MAELLDRIYDSLTTLFPGLSLRGRWAVLAGGFLFSLGVLWMVESQTGVLYLWHLQRRIELLEQLNSLADAGVSERAELKPVYDQLVTELDNQSYLSLSTTVDKASQAFVRSVVNFVQSEYTWRFFSGALLGILVVIAARRDVVRGDDSSRSALYGGLVFIFIGGLIGLLIPIIYSRWVNCIVVPIFMGAVILFIAKLKGRQPNS